MFNFFKKKNLDKLKDDQQTSFEIGLTASVLAYEIARSDGDISQEELTLLLNEIKKIANNVGKSDDEILKIIKIYSENSVSFYEFVEDITVFASGKDGIFNAGTPIGKTKENGEVELFVDPNQLSFVTVNLSIQNAGKL